MMIMVHAHFFFLLFHN